MTRQYLFTEFLPELRCTAQSAGALIMGHYQSGHTVERKVDASPVTIADREADELIVKALKELDATIPIVSEEGLQPDVSNAARFWLVDPLDGTRSFVRGSGYFTVNIALIENKRPVLGVIYEPVSKALYWGSKDGAWKEQNGTTQSIACRIAPAQKIAIVSHSHLNKATEAFLKQHPNIIRKPCASSIKFCFLAQGSADIYPRFGPTMEWDTAAGHAILEAAGGSMTTPEGEEFLYGIPGFANGNFIARGKLA